MSFFYMWGSFAGPVLAGAIYDRTQSYMTVLWIWFSLLTFATLLLVVFDPALGKPDDGNEPDAPNRNE